MPKSENLGCGLLLCFWGLVIALASALMLALVFDRLDLFWVGPAVIALIESVKILLLLALCPVLLVLLCAAIDRGERP